MHLWFQVFSLLSSCRLPAMIPWSRVCLEVGYTRKFDGESSFSTTLCSHPYFEWYTTNFQTTYHMKLVISITYRHSIPQFVGEIAVWTAMILIPRWQVTNGWCIFVGTAARQLFRRRSSHGALRRSFVQALFWFAQPWGMLSIWGAKKNRTAPKTAGERSLSKQLIKEKASWWMVGGWVNL